MKSVWYRCEECEWTGQDSELAHKQGQTLLIEYACCPLCKSENLQVMEDEPELALSR